MRRRGVLIVYCIFLIAAGAIGLYAEDVWEGPASVGRYGEFPAKGYYAASNSFPLNSLVEVYNKSGDRSAQVYIVSGLEDSNVFILLSSDAAEKLAISQKEVVSVNAKMIKAGENVPARKVLKSIFPEKNRDEDVPEAAAAEMEESEEPEIPMEIIKSDVPVDDVPNENSKIKAVKSAQGMIILPEDDIAEEISDAGSVPPETKEIEILPYEENEEKIDDETLSGEAPVETAEAEDLPADEEIFYDEAPAEEIPGDETLSGEAPVETAGAEEISSDEVSPLDENEIAYAEIEESEDEEIMPLPAPVGSRDSLITKPAAETEYPVPAPSETVMEKLPVLPDDFCYIQIGAFSSAESAEAYLGSVDTYYPVIVACIGEKNEGRYKVLAGPLRKDEKEAALRTFRYSGCKDAFVRNDG